MEDSVLESGMSEDEFVRFRTLIRRHTGIWLRSGKQVMLSSRLSRQLRTQGFDSYARYLACLEGLPPQDERMRGFINSITTNKTSFFREPHHFDFVRDRLVPSMMRSALQGGERAIRIWSAACSTGEEAYSIAICLLEALGSASRQWQIAILASDIDTEVLETAARGVYPEAALGDVCESLRRKYFLRGTGEMAGSVRVKRELSECVHFERINLMDPSWPVEGCQHAIFFRNALIYFQPDVQNQFLRRMLQYMAPEGYLFLGHSEHVPWLYDAVTPLQKTVFRRKLPGDAGTLRQGLCATPLKQAQKTESSATGNARLVADAI